MLEYGDRWIVYGGCRAFVQEYGYTVKVGMDEAHQRWLAENDAALKAAMPEGMTYIGTFAVIFGWRRMPARARALFGLDGIRGNGRRRCRQQGCQ